MKLFEKIKFYINMLLLNRKNTFVMFLGLGISLALIAQSLIFMYSFQYDAFQDFSGGTPTNQFKITIDAESISDEKTTILSKLNNITTDALENAGLENRLMKKDWFLTRGTMLYVGSNQPGGSEQLILDFNIYGVPADYFSAMESILYNGSLPQKSNEVIVVAKQNTIVNSNLTNLGLFPLYVPIFSLEGPYASVEAGIPAAGNYVNVSGIITKEDFANYKGLVEDDFAAMSDYFSDQFIITRYNNLFNYVESVNYFPGLVNFIGRLSFDLTKIDAFNVGGEIRQLNVLSQELIREFEGEGYSLVVDPNMVDLLEDFREEFLIFQLFGLLFMVPIIGMALSLTSYSTNLMKRTQKRQVSNLIQRGASRQEVLFILVMQVVELTLMAILVCVLVGYPFAWLMLKSNGFLNFSGISAYPTINMIVIYAVIAAGFTFALVVNAKNIVDMSKITTEEAYGATKEKKPIWQVLFLDVFLIIIGVALWLILRLQLQGTTAFAFAYSLGTIAPISLILGMILFATRIYPFIIKFLGNITWKRPKFGIISLSAKRSLRRKTSVIRSLVLITLTFTLIISSISTIQSYQEYDEELAYYELGSDILIRGVNVANDNLKNQINAIEGVQGSTYLKATSQRVSFEGVLYSYVVVGVNITEFPEIAYFEKEYLDSRSPSAFFSVLADSNDCVMQKDQLAKLGGAVNGSISVWGEKYPIGQVKFNLDIKGLFNFLPRFYVEAPSEDNTVYRFTIVGNYDLVASLAYSGSMSVAGDLLVKVKSGESISEVASTIENELGRNVEDVDELMGTNQGSLRNTMLFGSLNSSFISSLVITIAAISLMIIIQAVENEKEVVMLKTLGMSPRQLFFMFLTEALTVVIFGSIIGLGTGIFSANMLMEMLTFETVIPQTEIVYPPLQMILAFGILFFTAFLAAAFTSWLVFRKDTIQAIKQI